VVRVSFVTHLYGTAAQLASRNPLVPKGVLAAESDTGVVKVGDGVTRYNSLSVALYGTYASQTAVAAAESMNADQAIATSRLLGKVLAENTGGVLYLNRSGSDYFLIQGIGSQRYARWQLASQSSNPGSYALRQLSGCAIKTPMLSVDQGSGTRGGTWGGIGVSNAAAYGGTYDWSVTASATYSWTAPASSTCLGLLYVSSGNAGLALVSIGGSLTAANCLPTAQQVVDSGAYPNTILVANGGSLNPTDRVLDQYQGGGGTDFDARAVLATGLTASAYAVVITSTGYTHTSGTGSRVYVSGFGSATASTTPATASIDWYSVLPIGNQSSSSAWEYAIKCLPTGATTSTFVGNVHGYEVEDSLTFAVDDVATTLTDGQVVTAVGRIVATRTSHLLHPDTGSTTIASCVVNYSLDRLGLSWSPTITWAVDTRVDISYTMCPMDGMTYGSGRGFDRGATAGWPQAPVTFPGTSDTYYAISKSAAAVMWNRTGKVAVLFWVPDIYTFTNAWAGTTPNHMSIEDRNGTFSKAYATWVNDTGGTGNRVTVKSGTAKAWTARCALGYLSGGAEAALATI
jgi:hypothetical protein